MPYSAPAGEFRFLMDHVVGFDEVTATARFTEATPDMVSAIITEAAKLNDEVIAPLQRVGDTHGAVLENGVVLEPRICRGLPCDRRRRLDRHGR